MIYKQCVLKKGNKWQVSGIPEQYAKLGQCLKLKGEDGWIVYSVGDVVEPYHDSVRRQHRKNTGDSLPK